ncbi:AAA family ATPase [Veillonella sp.]|uniref:ATP-dependent DNA helicase n=1 Tax=Veillonella sp. TaxID=1926307 RepID=UPI0025E57B2A|nr:AAA family ATPase [Veillonella sp.]
MLRIDKAIYDTDKVICENIAYFRDIDRGFLCQNVLSQLRNFTEYIAMKIYCEEEDFNPNDQNLREDALKKMLGNGKLRFLSKLHQLLQKSASHYTLDKDNSERLMLKYYEFLLKIKKYLYEEFSISVLENIQEFPINLDTELIEYYRKIAQKIEIPTSSREKILYDDRYYIQKIKPFFIDQNIYYEITFTIAKGNISKFDRVIAFTKKEIVDNYAVKLSVYKDTIDILDRRIDVLIIDEYEVSIRPCELENFAKILGFKERYSIKSKEYKRLMSFIMQTGLSLTELVSSDDIYYNSIKSKVLQGVQSGKFYNVLDKCRDIINNKLEGQNILRYLLYKMNNKIINRQYSQTSCNKLSELYLSFGCIPFDQMPYCTSLIQHNPKTYDLLLSIPIHNREHELLARFIKNNTEVENTIFTLKNSITTFDNIGELIERYNSILYYKHINRRLEIYKKFIYMNGYVDDCINIIRNLRELSSSGVAGYSLSVESWLSRDSYTIDDDNKNSAMHSMFASSHVALIYGAAGTGKSTLINHISNFWSEQNKLFLANTHPAVDNLKRKVSANNCTFSTIAKFLRSRDYNEYDLLVIDECSTVSNDDMRRILDKTNFKLIVLVGDIYQIESIYFGNWFSIADKFIPETSRFELTNPFRTNNEILLTLWQRVRDCSDDILEYLTKNNFSHRLDDSIFQHADEDEIILCLNYDGLYGINNINRILQNNNSNEAIIWGINTYKVGDPILFNESNIFSPLIHNNTKGKIVGIQPKEFEIFFTIELEQAINEIEASGYDFLLEESKHGKSIITFSINKYASTDEDDDSNVVPFQVAYAVSIHKSQGLEYNSVKIVITNEVGEQITHNIFYTAITRTREKLKIYWSPETEKTILDSFDGRKSLTDAHILKNFL